MSSILRSGKFVRCFSSAARALINPPKGYDSSLLQSSRSIASGFSQTWSQEFSTQRNVASESMEPLLQRLDADVRRHGRLSRRDLDEVLEEVRLRQAVTSSQSLLVIRCCGSLVPEESPAERTRLVDQIWKTLTERGVPMDISHYNALLRVYIENEHDFSPNEFLKELEEKGLQPNRVTYQRLMWRHCQCGDVEGASHVLEMMRAQRLPLSGAVLDALVLGHVRQADLAGARAVVAAMAAAGLRPTASTFALLAGGLAARGDMDGVRQIINECQKDDIYLSDKEYMDVIEECAINNQDEHIPFFLEQMQHGAGYNQDCISLILRLLTRGCETAAFQVLRSMTRTASPTESVASAYQGAFFVKQLVKLDRPIQNVIDICKRMVDEGLSQRPQYVAIDTALQNGKVDLALALFKTIKETGAPLRQHYFWPLLVSKGKSKDAQGVLDILSKMTSDYDLKPSSETLRDYVMPFINKGDPYKTIDSLRSAGVSIAMASRSVVFSLLRDNDSQKAAQVALKYGTRVNLSIYGRTLNEALIQTQDVESYVTIIHLSCHEESRQNQVPSNEENEEAESGQPRVDMREHVGRLLHSLIVQSTKVIPALPLIFQGLHANGIGISSKWAEKIQERLGEQLTSEISESLGKLTAGDLELTVIEAPSIPSIRRDPEQLEALLAAAERTKSHNTTGIKKQLFEAYIRARNVEKTEEMLKRLEEDKFVLGAGLTVVLFDMYTQIGNLQKALEYKQLMDTKEPDFPIDTIKILRLAELLVKEERFDSAVELLQLQGGEARSGREPSFLTRNVCWRLLNTLADMGDLGKLQKMFDTLIEKKFVEPNNVILGPLVKVHLVAGDTGAALDVFGHCCKTYNCTPWKGELTRRLISDEDAAGLQRLADLSTAVHGEVNSLYDLVFGFVECGRLRQARRILETPGLRTRNQRFNYACERYGEEGKVDCLEGLLEATRELSHIDRSEVFQQLLNTYIRVDDVDKAFGLWTVLQEESLTPTDKFLIQLADFLKSKDMAVPFVVPEKEPPKLKSETAQPRQREGKTKQMHTSVQKDFTTAISNGDLNAAISIKNSLKPDESLSHFSKSQLMDELMKTNRCDEAEAIFMEMLKEGSLPSVREFRSFLNCLSFSGNVDAMNRICAQLTEDQKRLSLFDNRLCNTYMNAGRSVEYLQSLTAKAKECAEADLQVLEGSFPKGGIMGVLESDPSLLKPFEELATVYSSRGLSTPVNMLWVHHLLSGNTKAAQAVWDQSLRSNSHILFKKVLKVAKEKKDAELTSKLIGFLKTNDVITNRALAIAYSNHIDILLNNARDSEALQTVDAALAGKITIDDLSLGTMTRLKQAVEAQGGKFKHRLPVKSKDDTKLEE